MKTGTTQLRKWHWFACSLVAALALGGWTLDYLPDKTESISKTFRERSGSREIARAPRAGVRHTKEFRTTAIHGSQFLQDKASCKGCHGEDLRGGTSGVACMQCHRALDYFDHFGEKPGSHGEAYLRAPENCAGCHGADWKGKDGAFGCLDCHNFPHRGGWAVAERHGEAYLTGGRSADASDPASCLYCHSESSGFKERHPGKFVSCASCHVAIPHPNKNWIWGKHHVDARQYSGKCLNCHTDMKRHLPNFKKGCASCHKGTTLEPVIKFLDKEITAVRADGKASGAQTRTPAHAPAHWKSYQPFEQATEVGAGKGGAK